MAILVVNDDSTPAEIREAIGHLRERQRRCQLAETRDSLARAIDDLLELLILRRDT